MIKNNNFCKMWLLVIGMMVGNVMSLYGAEFNVTTFLSSQDSPSLREINQFSNNLEQLNDECKADQLQSCITLNTIVKSQLFIDRCKAIFRINDINLAKAKTKLADTCFFISENSKIISQEEKKPIVNLIKPHLSGVTALPLAIGENQPSLWDRNTIYKKAEFSINAIKELGKIITDHKMGEAEARSELLTKNLLGYLTYIDSFFKEEKNLASKSLIGSDIERNKNFLITLVKITANNETVNDAYNTLTKYVPSLPSLEELFPKPVMLQASPAQPIFRQDEVAILDEAIKNPKNDNESLILKTFKKIIKIIQDPNPNTWELKNEFETISFDFLWKNVRIDDQIIQIIKKLLDHETFKNVYNKITDNNHKQIIDKSISKIKSFLNSLSDISAQNQQPQTPTFQPIVSQFPTIAAAAAFQGLHPQPITYQAKPISNQLQTVTPPAMPFFNQQQSPMFAPQPTISANPVAKQPQPQQQFVQKPQPFVQPMPAFANQSTQHNKNWPSQPVKGSIIPRRKRTQLLKPLEIKLSQEDFERQQNEFRNNINELNINIALNNVISDEDIENIVTNLDLATCIDLFKLTRLFNALSTKQNRTDLKQHLQDYHLKPPYEGLLNEQEINTLSNNSFENNVIKEIDNFFVRGCPDKELKNFTSQVIQLAGLDLNNPYIIKIIDEPIFKDVCLFIYEGFDYPGKKKFDAAYERLFNIQVNKNPTSADISKTPLNPQSALPPTGNQAKQQPTVAKNLIPQKPTVGVPHPTPTVIPAAQNANPNPPSATPTNNNPTDNTGSGWSLRGIMSGAWSTLTSIPLIGTLLSSISNLISSFFTPSK